MGMYINEWVNVFINERMVLWRSVLMYLLMSKCILIIEWMYLWMSECIYEWVF